MNGIGAIQPLSPAETWEAWQALMQASLASGDTGHTPLHGADVPTVAAPCPLSAPQPPSAQQAVHAAQAASDAQAAQAQADMPQPASTPMGPAWSRELPPAATAVSLHAAAPPGDAPPAAARLADASAAVLPMAPVLMTPLALADGPELRWRANDAAEWRRLFDDAGKDDSAGEDGDAPVALPEPPGDTGEAQDMPEWARALVSLLRGAARSPAAAAALRPALQAWRAGLPVLLASPAGLASLQPARDASTWHCRRWPARWRSAKPAAASRWWAVRLGMTPQGCPRTLRELAGSAVLAPGQVSCELRLDGAAPGLARWADVLVQAPASPGLRALLAARPSITWLLCNQPLWPRED